MQIVPSGAYWIAPRPVPPPLLTTEQRQFLADVSLLLGVAVSVVTLVNALKA